MRLYIPAVLFPETAWARGYGRGTFVADMLAGATVAAVLIPNAMAYALLAGLSPAAGLYAALPAVVIAALWGGSSRVITGPVGVVSLLTLTSLLSFAEPRTAAFATLAIALAVLTGLFQFLFGAFRLGFLARLIPHAVLVGFANAAALIIALSQLPSLMGFSITQKEHVIGTIAQLVTHMGDARPMIAAVGIVLAVGLYACKRRFPAFPGALAALAVAVVVSLLTDLGNKGVPLIGHIPSGLPVFSFHDLTPDALAMIAPQAVLIAIVGFVETFAIAKTLAGRTGEKVAADRVLVGQGLANTAAGLAGGLPVSGSFSVSALNHNAGARTIVSSIVAGAIILVTLLFLTPLLGLLPKFVLAAIVTSAVVSLVDVTHFRRLFTVSRTDGLTAITTFVFSFLLKPDDAIVIGIIVALLLFVHRAMHAAVPEVGVHPVHGTLCSLGGEEQGLLTYPGIVIARIDRSLVYANSEHVVERIEELLAARHAAGQEVGLLVLHASGMNTLDATGVEALEEFVHACQKRNIIVGIVSVKAPVREILRRAGLWDHFTYFRSPAELRARCETWTTA